MSTSATDLGEVCREHAGAALRTVIAYDQEGFEIAHVRDDLDGGYSRRQFSSLVAVARDLHRPLQLLPGGGTDVPVGAYRSTRHRFENAAVLQVVADEARGYLVAVDPGAEDRLEDLPAALRTVGDGSD